MQVEVLLALVVELLFEVRRLLPHLAQLFLSPNKVSFDLESATLQSWEFTPEDLAHDQRHRPRVLVEILTHCHHCMLPGHALGSVSAAFRGDWRHHLLDVLKADVQQLDEALVPSAVEDRHLSRRRSNAIASKM